MHWTPATTAPRFRLGALIVTCCALLATGQAGAEPENDATWTTAPTTSAIPPDTTVAVEPVATTLPPVPANPPAVRIDSGSANGSVVSPDDAAFDPTVGADVALPSAEPPGLELALMRADAIDAEIDRLIVAERRHRTALGIYESDLAVAAASARSAERSLVALSSADRGAAERATESYQRVQRMVVGRYVGRLSDDEFITVFSARDFDQAAERQGFLGRMSMLTRQELSVFEAVRASLSARTNVAVVESARANEALAQASERHDREAEALAAVRLDLERLRNMAAARPSLIAGIPDRVFDAYVRAARMAAITDPSCHLPWWGLAAVGRVETGHGARLAIGRSGATAPRVLGPVLDGNGPVAMIADTDRGIWDGDAVHDRAIGPMQFIPSTWRANGLDASGDGTADPFNLYDATFTAARYLCAAVRPSPADSERVLRRAWFSYNHSMRYVNSVWDGSAPYREAASSAAALPESAADTVATVTGGP